MANRIPAEASGKSKLRKILKFSIMRTTRTRANIVA
jgi:hypothetical protein